MASAKSERISQLMRVLERTDAWVPGSVLAKMVGTSERSIRNYIAQINASSHSSAIESCKEGYRLARTKPEGWRSNGSTGQNAPAETSGLAPSPNPKPRTGAVSPHASLTQSPALQRQTYVLSRLVNAHTPLSVFDLADDLNISESTLASSVLPRVRQLVRSFNLSCETHDFSVQLIGSEQDKRKLLGHMATHSARGYFSSTRTLKDMFPDFDIDSMLGELVGICQRSELLINDFALNNLLVHLLVIIIRLTSNNELSEHEGVIDAEGFAGQFKQRNSILRCASHIGHYLEREFSCTIPPVDYQQIIMLIALSVDHFTYDELSLDNLAQVIDQSFLNTVHALARKTTDRYGIPPFDESLMLQLTLHMYNAYQRATYHVGYPNPLAGQIKQEHAPVYDMAVYFSHRFANEYDIELSEDEIAFIAFHIGAYLERCATPDHVATCIVIVEEYHDFAQRLIEGVRSALGDDANIIGIMNYDGYLVSHPECDLIITTIDVPVHHGVKVLIGPILTKQSIRKIQDKLSDVLEEKRMGRARQFLQRVLRPELYCRNVELDGGPDAYIDHLGCLCIGQGFATQAYIDDVHLRERVSSTAFADCLAVPHAINEFPERSFIAVLQNDTPIPWGRHTVHFVLLMGISKDEMGLFRDALDLIIDLFSSMEKTMRLMRTRDFEEFLSVFTEGVSS